MTVAGTWAEVFSIPGPSLIVTIDSAGNGSGTYAIEAGRSGVLQVTGSSTGAVMVLTLRYDYGLVRTFTGMLIDPNHLTGTFEDTMGTISFVRR